MLLFYKYPRGKALAPGGLVPLHPYASAPLEIRRRTAFGFAPVDKIRQFFLHAFIHGWFFELGDDVFETGVWMNDESDQATITDFTASDDRMIYYYVAGEAAPELDVVTRDNDDGGTDAFLVADGVEVVRLVNAGSDFNVEDHVSLVELAS